MRMFWFSWIRLTFLAHWLVSVQTNNLSDFTSFSIDNRMYLLSTTTQYYDASVQMCAAIDSTVVMFDTNLEFSNVTTYLLSKYKIFDVWVDIFKNRTGHFWKLEEIAKTSWGSSDPNDGCELINTTKCFVRSTSAGLRDRYNGSYTYQVLCKAICNVGYIRGPDGVSCVDVNECLKSPCGQTCTNLDGSYRCGCNQGYTLGSDQTSCADVDECGLDVKPCQQLCQNQVGSYTCSCSAGYRLAYDQVSCLDIDECLQKPCGQFCTNTVGSYLCSCVFGYTLNSDMKSCNCSWPTFCQQPVICSSGFQLVDNKCVEVNECELNTDNCSQICQNSAGSYICTCYDGYVMDKIIGDCVDINECLSSPCQQVCTNLNGSYSCGCRQGFVFARDKKVCVDMDECQTTRHNCSQLCNNTVGGYTCSCHQGYELHNDSRFLCVDVDECGLGSHNCSDGCNNTAGSYVCTCKDGYHIDTHDPFTCVDMDECQQGLHNCTQNCTNSIGSYVCSCFHGYRLDNNNNVTCLDINECKENVHTCENTCVNTLGSYTCTCPLGYQLDQDGSSCVKTRSQPSCPCSCRTQTKINMSSTLTAVQKEIDQIKKNLTVETHDLSSYIRSKTSATDDRTSADTIGSLGAALFGFTIGFVLVPDILAVFQFVLPKLWQTCRTD